VSRPLYLGRAAWYRCIRYYLAILLTLPGLVMVCGFLLTAGAAVFLTLGLRTAPELFSTEYHFRGSGVAQTVGRGGLIASRFIVLMLFDRGGIAGVIGALAGMYIAVALLFAVLGIETNQRSLEALVPETPPPLDPSVMPRAAE